MFNGEIYNFRELRRELDGTGHRFRTTSDTEVLLERLPHGAPRCVEHLRGMFAFALWDAKRQRLILARDHFGKKPLFLHENAGERSFASEIKALLRVRRLTPASTAPARRLSVYRYVPAPHTLFTGIRKLMPGTYAVWERGQLSETAFYRPPDGDAPDQRRDSRPRRRFPDKLDEAVRLRMVTRRALRRVPLGRARLLDHRRADEPPLGAAHQHFLGRLPRGALFRAALRRDDRAASSAPTTPSSTIAADDLMQHLPRLIDHQDAPVAEASNIPIYLISREAAKSVKMVLTGEGSDELLGGYPKHSAERYAAIYQRLVPACAHDRVVAPLINALPYRFRRIKISRGLDRAARSGRAHGALDGRADLCRARPASVGGARAATRRPGSVPGRRAAFRPGARALFRPDLVAAGQSPRARRPHHHGGVDRGAHAVHGYRSGAASWRACRTSGASAA